MNSLTIHAQPHHTANRLFRNIVKLGIDLIVTNAFIQGGEVEASNERCPLTQNFLMQKNSQSETERAFDCHILAPVKHLSN